VSKFLPELVRAETLERFKVINIVRKERISGGGTLLADWLAMRMTKPAPIEKLLETYYLQLFRFAARLSGSPARAMLLTQCTFKLALERSRHLPVPANVRPWLFTLLFKLFLENRLRLERA
jgi:hypothetical protein